MIKSDMKHGEVYIAGDMVSILDDFTMICRKLHEMLTEAGDEKFADRTIAYCVALSKKSPEELEKEVQDEIDDAKSAN